MNTVVPTTDNSIETYLNRLADALAAATPHERDEIVREIRAHIQDSVSSASDPEAAVARVLRLLGSPEELAERYTTESLLTRAGHSLSPWLLLRTSWRWAKLGITGTMAFFVALFGYSLALGLTVAVFLKPFMPSKIGLWIGSGNLNVGAPSHPEGMHELLGQWFVPVIAVAAFAIAVGTTHALRWLIRRRSSSSEYQVSREARTGQI